MSDRFSMEGKVAIITGGGTGIGRAAALVLSEHGADVVLAGRRVEPLESTAEEIRALANHMELNPSASAALTCSTTLSVVPATAVSPILTRCSSNRRVRNALR